MSKRLLFVTSRLPWPHNSGRKVSLYHYCRGLFERYGYEIALFVFPEWDQPRDATDKPAFISEVRFAAPISRAEKLANLATHTLSGKPLQAALYKSRKNRRLLQKHVAEFRPDVMLFDMIRLAPYMRDFKDKVRCILDLDDLLSVRYARQLSALDEGTSIAGHYAGGMNPTAERVLCRGRLGRMILKSEQKRLARSEPEYANEAEGVILVSEKEVATLNQRLDSPRAVAVPMGVDMAAFAYADAEKRPRTFGFVGNLHVAANVSSLEYIVQSILPKLTPPYCFEVIGPVPDAVRARFEGVQNLSLFGEVADLAPVMHSWQFSLCPIAFGSGIKTKILEAMAAELPVLTNTVGSEGINATHGEAIFVYDDPQALADTANALLSDPLRCREIGKNAAAFVGENFAWDRIFDAFQNLDL
ncbi:MAG: glycosyltransferase [Clostridia bacterium]|nr:glycosyltransferase [Clostridia bacterium]